MSGGSLYSDIVHSVLRVLIINLGATTIFRFFIWLIIGLVIYFLYSRKHSKLNGDL